MNWWEPIACQTSREVESAFTTKNSSTKTNEDKRPSRMFYYWIKFSKQTICICCLQAICLRKPEAFF